MNNLLSCGLRNETGTNASHRTRRRGNVPGIIYGHHFTNYPLEIDSNQLNKLIREFGENAVISVSINGTDYPAMIKEVQRDVISDEIIHIDLQQVNVSEKIHTQVPITISGKKLIKDNGILQQQLEKINIECYPNDVPKSISVDVSNLTLGNSLRISDVEFGDEISILSDTEEIIATLSTFKEEFLDEDEPNDDFIQVKEEPKLVGEDEKTEEE
ncbi:50S ribosomal protein L25 [Dethiothermospora halolimnae]|uniref:50S ribosomal protein L25 n=1 Tax=Dethiothermospora halolimnae TaxID=3114390 RepID=UPI003CCC0067